MGTGDNEIGKGKAKRGTNDTASALSALGSRGRNPGKLNWDDADPKNLAAVIVSAVEAGGAASFSRSRDAGAVSLTIYLDGDKKTLWFNKDSSLDDELEVVIHFLSSLKTG